MEGSNTEILLESGTNEVELLEFYIGTQSYGVNVLKVKRIVNFSSVKITEQPCTHESILGVINLQESIIPVIDLATYFLEDHIQNEDSRKIVITEFNNNVQGFVVDGVNKIHRISWGSFQSVHERFCLDYITGVCIIENKNVSVVDFEKIIGALSHTDIISGMDLPDNWSDIDNVGRQNIRIICAEDSNMVRELIQETLEEAGYGIVKVFPNGKALNDAIIGYEEQAKQEGKEISEYFNILLTDLEMPLMDGFTLCKSMKEKHPDIPVIILSSLISDEVIERCKTVKADATVSKGEYDKLIEAIDGFFSKPEFAQ
jgi:two-component system chemotaxis response regulator CheV